MKILLLIFIILLVIFIIIFLSGLIYLKKNGAFVGEIVTSTNEDGTNVWNFKFYKGWDYERIAKQKTVIFRVKKEGK